MAVTSLTACRDKDKSNDEEQPQVIRSNDELKPSAQDVLTAPQQLKSTLNTLTSDVNDGFDEITSLEQAIDETSVSQLSQSKRAKLRNNILLMKNTIQDRLRALAELDDDLDELDDKSRTEIAQTINNLRQQLALQQILSKKEELLLAEWDNVLHMENEGEGHYLEDIHHHSFQDMYCHWGFCCLLDLKQRFG